MALPALPKNPKVDDLIPLLAALDTRITALEAYVARNDSRITALEKRYDQVVAERGERIATLESEMAHHQAGAAERQREVDQLRAGAGRLRWAMTHGRRP